MVDVARSVRSLGANGGDVSMFHKARGRPACRKTSPLFWGEGRFGWGGGAEGVTFS